MEKELSFSLEEVRGKLASIIDRLGGYFETSISREHEFQIVAAFSGSDGRIFIRARRSGDKSISGSIALPRTKLKIESKNLAQSFFDDFVRKLEVAFLRGGG